MLRPLAGILVCLLLCVLVMSCGGEEDSSSQNGDLDGDHSEEEPVLDGDSDEGTNPAMDGDEDGDLDPEKPDSLPESLPVTFARENPGNPIPEEEITAFTKRVVGFMAKVGYYDYLLRFTHGVHQSTGLPTWRIWWTSTYAVKEGDTVTFTCRETDSLETPDGGHNLMTRTAKVLASAISGYLLTGDARMHELTREMCKGVTASMRGMVYDENDPIDHLMARNIIPQNQSYTSFEGKNKAFDCTNWHRAGSMWNCERFNYVNNPTWGDVWVTSMRSKDDVSRVLRANAYIRYAVANAPDEDVRQACGETADYLQRFSKDVVDSDYAIRTKDAEGHVYTPTGDLASYTTFDVIWPDSECNAKSAHALIAYDRPLENDCGTGARNTYERTAMNNKYFNGMIIRNHHLAHLVQSLIHWELDRAEQLLQGLVDRYESALAYTDEELPTGRDQWERDIASSLMQAAAVGYPLNETEARLLMKYWNRSMDVGLEWPYWDFWADSVPDGRYQPAMPIERKEDDEVVESWLRSEDFGEFLDLCWSPLRNENGMKLLDCDIVRDIDNWNPEWADAQE